MNYEVISKNPERDAKIISAREVDKRTLKSIGEEFGLTGQRIRDIITRAREVKEWRLGAPERLLKEMENRVTWADLEARYSASGGMLNVANECLQFPINELELSVRSANVLMNINIVRVVDLVRMSRDDLLEAPNCGLKSIREIEDLLRGVGLALANEPANSLPKNFNALRYLKEHSGVEVTNKSIFINYDKLVMSLGRTQAINLARVLFQKIFLDDQWDI